MKIIFLVTSVLVSQFAYSGNVINTKISRIHMYMEPKPSGGIFIQVTTDRVTNCINNKEFFINLNNQPRGALLYSHAMAAMSNDLKVSIYGTGICAQHGAETIADLQVFK